MHDVNSSTSFSTHYPANVVWTLGNTAYAGWRKDGEPRQRGGYSGDWNVIGFDWETAKTVVNAVVAEFDQLKGIIAIDEQLQVITGFKNEDGSPADIVAQEAVWNGERFDVWMVDGPWLELGDGETPADYDDAELTDDIEDDSCDCDICEECGNPECACQCDRSTPESDFGIEDDGDARFDADRDDRS